MRMKVLFSQKALPEAVKLLENKYEVVEIREGDAKGLVCELQNAHAIIVGTGTKLSPDLIVSAKNLKVIARTGIGLDNVDVDVASQKGVCVTNVPAGNTISVAEHAVSLMCALSKAIIHHDTAVREGNFRERRRYCSRELFGKTMGIVGFGAIGKLVGDMCRAAFSMRVLFFDPFVSSFPDYAEKCDDLLSLVRVSDFVSLHMPLLSSTKDMIDDLVFECMKPTAYLINTGRGGIVNHDALLKALDQGKLAGAALDVFDKEPVPLDDPILQNHKIILSPHIAGLTQECAVRLACGAVNCAIDVLEGRRPATLCNEQQLIINGAKLPWL